MFIAQINFDIRSIYLMHSAVLLALGCYLLLTLRAGKVTPGFVDWIQAAFGLATFSVLVGLRLSIPDLLSVVLANTVGCYSIVMLARGMHRFFGVPWSRAWEALPVLVAGLFSFLTYVYPNFELRVIAFGLIFAAVLIGLLRLAPAIRRQSGGALAGWLTVMLAILILHHLAHVVGAVVTWPNYGARLIGSSASGFVWLIALVQPTAHLGLFLGLIAAHAHQLFTEREHALQEVHTLRGIIPVCAACKKIRNTEGVWDQMEVYISEHSEARFSHGYCPECARKFMAEYEALAAKERQARKL